MDQHWESTKIRGGGSVALGEPPVPLWVSHMIYGVIIICQVDTLKNTVSGIKLKMCCSLCLMPCLTDKYSVTAKTWRAAYVRNKQLGPVHDSHKSLNFP